MRMRTCQTGISAFLLQHSQAQAQSLQVYLQSVFHFNTKGAAVQVLVLHQSVKCIHNPEMKSWLRFLTVLRPRCFHKTELGINGSPPRKKVGSFIKIFTAWAK